MSNYIERMDDRIERLEEALRRIADWAEAYPLQVSLDRLSASAMRHVITQVGKIAKDALETAEAAE